MLKILIIRLSSIGDILHAFTAVEDIVSNFPACQIDWLVDESFQDIVKLSPHVHNIISIPLRQWKKNKLTWFSNLVKWKIKLGRLHYDYIIDLQGLIKTALISKLFYGPVHGLDWCSAREKISCWLYDYRYAVSANNVAVIRMRALVQQIFDYKIANLRQFQFGLNLDFKLPQAIVNQDGQHVYRYVVLLHGTSKLAKEWPLINWVNLARYILNNCVDYHVVVTYSNLKEYTLVQQVADLVGDSRLIVVPQLPIADLVRVVYHAALIVGVDTGFTHLANLLNKKVLGIYLASNPSYGGLLEGQYAKNIEELGSVSSYDQVIAWLPIMLT